MDMAITETTEVQATNPIKNPTIPEISDNPYDFQKELQKIAAEQGVKIVDGNTVPVGQEQTEAAAQPSPPTAAAQPEAQVEVPQKFQTKEGQVDIQKVEKSTIHADEAIKKYREKEAELRKLQSAVTQMQRPQVAPLTAQGQLTPDAINQALANGKNPGQVLLELSQMTYQQALADARAEQEARFGAIQDRLEAESRTRELQSLVGSDPELMTPQMIDRLSEIRKEYPHINQSPNPWQEAYDKHLAIEVKRQKSGLQVQPNPTPTTVRAPATPVGGVNRTQTTSPNLAAISKDPKALNSFLDSLPNDNARAAFWASALRGATKGV